MVHILVLAKSVIPKDLEPLLLSVHPTGSLEVSSLVVPGKQESSKVAQSSVTIDYFFRLIILPDKILKVCWHSTEIIERTKEWSADVHKNTD